MQATLNNGKSFNFNQGENLLHAALQQGIVLEHSCKTGRCGVCKAKAASGETSVLQVEESLSLQEQEEGFILTCCRTATTDVHLDIEDLGFLAGIETKTLPCRIDALDQLNNDVIQVTLRLPPNQPLRFLAGQYIDLIANGIRRSYSVANAPRDDNKLLLDIRQVEKGQMSDYLFQTAKVNDLLRIEGPLGTFCLRETTKTPLFIATGTGIAPIKAMIATLPNTQPISVYWGGRTEADIYWQGIPEHMNLVSVLSRADDAWQGVRGYVQDAVLADYSDLSDFVVYACGSEAMIRDAKIKFIQAGLSESSFYSDAFVSSS
jgi:CDP-4-dehydro-6-deoxyglucose reductase